MVGGNWLKSIFFLFLDHLPGFPNYTFLNFQKKFFHSTLLSMLLFALATDVLSKKFIASSHIHGLSLGKATIKLQQYADDTTLLLTNIWVIPCQIQQMAPTRPSQILLKLHQNGFFDE